MADQKKYVAAAPGPMGPSEYLNLWEVEELCRQARKHDMPDESDFRIDYDPTFLRYRYVVQHDPSMRRVGQEVPDRLPPVEQAIASGGDRLVELGFVRRSDSREPVTIRLQVQDDASNVVIASLDLTEHQFAMLLSGSVIKAKDQI